MLIQDRREVTSKPRKPPNGAVGLACWPYVVGGGGPYRVLLWTKASVQEVEWKTMGEVLRGLCRPCEVGADVRELVDWACAVEVGDADRVHPQLEGV